MAEKRKPKAEVEKRETESRVERRPTKAEVEASQKFALKVHVINRSFDLVGTGLRFGGWIALIYMGIVRPLQITAGKQTVVDFMYKAVLDLKLHMVVPWAAAALFGGLWYRERNLRKKTVAREHGRVTELEKQLDPGRTSSGLTIMGEDPEGRP